MSNPSDPFADHPQNIAQQFGEEEEMNSTKKETAGNHSRGQGPPKHETNRGSGVNGFESYEESRKRLSVAFPNANLENLTVDIWQKLLDRHAKNQKSGAHVIKSAKDYGQWEEHMRELGEFIADSWKDAPTMNGEDKERAKVYKKTFARYIKTQYPTEEKWERGTKVLREAWADVGRAVKRLFWEATRH
jgi:hypothetical protein